MVEPVLSLTPFVHFPEVVGDQSKTVRSRSRQTVARNAVKFAEQSATDAIVRTGTQVWIDCAARQEKTLHTDRRLTQERIPERKILRQTRQVSPGKYLGNRGVCAQD